MLKNVKKLLIVFTVLLLFISSSCFATTVNSEKVKMELVEDNVCTIKISDTATFEKKLIDYDLEKKELTFRLKVTNDAEPIINNPYEIVLVIDNSLSMKSNTVRDNVTRLKEVTDSAKTLATKLLEQENTKIAVVSFSTSTHTDEEGHLDKEGTIDDAILRNALTSDSSTILSSIEEIATDTLQGARTNIDAGLQVAKTCFSSEETNKYIVLLTDGIPNRYVGSSKIGFSGETSTQTKATLESIEDAGINVISAMIGLNPNEIEPSTQLSYEALSEEVFGTQEEPTVGKFYYVEDNDIEEAICETIYSNIVDTTSNTLTNINIYDYLTQEIVDNFDFSYVTTPTLGEASPTIDLQNNSILWHIDELGPQSSAYLTYKLTLKENIDSGIIDKVLDVTEKVDITTDETDSLTSDVTPKVKLTMDNTTAPTDIPQTGSTSTLMIVFAIVVIAAITFGIRYYSIKIK